MAKTYYVLNGNSTKVVATGSYNLCMEFVKRYDLNYDLGLSGPMDENTKNKLLTISGNLV